jgi:predicted HTH domain antitoxin
MKVARAIAAARAGHPITHLAAERNPKGNRMTDQDITKQAALSLLEQGVATLSEAARLAGQSRQIMRYWARELPEARSKYLRAEWKKALKEVKSNGVSQN